ncbi:hypothetical protein [Streptomyces sporangiiformans]|uniref:Uncharacterized protein n=1 Tax=Streptomyces sporangiiformans TaxID=2315329 RepID=A0A505DDD3_9ACTN|nr:hypothetical protein [Streptomyces sporangiiformans]TPQ19735.1 hypothetical protein FGD71_024085 [Streptomyces sporangiiformans]
MDLTGHATDFVADSTFPAAMRRFVRRRHELWPGLFLQGELLVSGALAADWCLTEVEDGDYSGVVTFSSGQEMEDFWEENGYALDASGEGPYAVFYRLQLEPLHAKTVTGVRSASPEAATAVEGTGLLLSEYFAVSVVTPEDPASDPFSESVVNDFVASFGASDRPDRG